MGILVSYMRETHTAQEPEAMRTNTLFKINNHAFFTQEEWKSQVRYTGGTVTKRELGGILIPRLKERTPKYARTPRYLVERV